MTPLTLYLAKLIGLFLLVAALALGLRRDVMVKTASEMLRDRGLLLLIGSIRVAAGLAIVLAHNIWSGGALPVAVTLIGWVVLARGLVLLFAHPETLVALFHKMRFEQNYYVFVAISFVLGLYLTVAGFAA